MSMAEGISWLLFVFLYIIGLAVTIVLLHNRLEGHSVFKHYDLKGKINCLFGIHDWYQCSHEDILRDEKDEVHHQMQTCCVRCNKELLLKD